MSEAPWRAEKLNDERIGYMKSETAQYQRSESESVLAIDDTLCEHVGSLFEYIDTHYNHSNGQHPLAHNLVTSHYVSGAVRFRSMQVSTDGTKSLPTGKHLWKTISSD
ncbi:hypothetical protein KFU94_71200 [Chloroflexi bacterium TSY]|nr:hypothetical protein [Chloroflexi bacterium TSY]